MADSYIRFENVTKKFGKQSVLNNVNIDIESGKITGFVGRNGSGKTVIFKLISGLILPTEGKIFFEGKDITASKKFINSIGVLIEAPGFIDHYSGMKNLKILNGLSKNKASMQYIIECMLLVGLDPNNNKPVKTYSLGMRQKLGIVQAVMNKPKLLILDEPMNGLDEDSVIAMRDFLKELRDKYNTTIILASHNKDDIEALCDKLFFVANHQVKEGSKQV